MRNNSNYLPSIDLNANFINENTIILIGGGRKEGNNDIYFTNNIFYYNVEKNIILDNSNDSADFSNNFIGGDVSIFSNNCLHLLVKCRREAGSFGPFQRNLLSLDLNENSWKFEQLIDIE